VASPAGGAADRPATSFTRGWAPADPAGEADLRASAGRDFAGCPPLAAQQIGPVDDLIRNVGDRDPTMVRAGTHAQPAVTR
jgi:hypothetical protein